MGIRYSTETKEYLKDEKERRKTVKESPCLSINDVTDIFECVVCKDLPSTSYIYQCVNGHLLCADCHAKLTNCPICRVELGKIRSIAAEKMASKIPKPCTFEQQGCKEEMTEEQLRDHEKKLFVQNCSLSIPFLRGICYKRHDYDPCSRSTSFHSVGKSYITR